MNIRRKQIVDWYLGGALLFCLKPIVMGLGKLMRRDHGPGARGELCFTKLVGGGSLEIALPMLLGVRRMYPKARLTLVTTPAIRPFAESLRVFDRVLVIDDRGLARVAFSGLATLWRLGKPDTLVDLEVYSRLSAVFSVFTRARNRIGFYLESVVWRRDVYTHLLFFNRFSGSYLFYDAVARLLGAEPASAADCSARLGLERARLAGRIAVGHACSDFGVERMLTPAQWLRVFRERPPRGEVVFLGAARDRDGAERIIDVLRGEFPEARFANRCGELGLAESLAELAACEEFRGVDSSLLHYARWLGLRCLSFWGPTDPRTRLRPIPGLVEEAVYRKVACSPCIHVSEEPPCRGRNVCVQRLFPGEKGWSVGTPGVDDAQDLPILVYP